MQQARGKRKGEERGGKRYGKTLVILLKSEHGRGVDNDFPLAVLRPPAAPDNMK